MGDISDCNSSTGCKAGVDTRHSARRTTCIVDRLMGMRGNPHRLLVPFFVSHQVPNTAHMKPALHSLRHHMPLRSNLYPFRALCLDGSVLVECASCNALAILELRADSFCFIRRKKLTTSPCTLLTTFSTTWQGKCAEISIEGHTHTLLNYGADYYLVVQHCIRLNSPDRLQSKNNDAAPSKKQV